MFWRKFYRFIRTFRTKKRKTVFLICALTFFCFQNIFHIFSYQKFGSIFINQKMSDIRTEEEYKKIDFNVSCYNNSFYIINKQ